MTFTPGKPTSETARGARDRVVTPNFITDIIDGDLRSGAVTSIVTRFPPEPNGYLHIGHSKAVCLSFGVAEDYGGVTYLRFDDTNPTTEDEEYVRAIIETIDWLGFRYVDIRHASDYFPQLYEYALTLIDRGLAYVDTSSEEDIRRMRGTVTEPGVNSPDRDRSPAENRDLFERMRAGEFAQGSMVLRAKIDMAAANMKMRDPLLYRIVDAAHYRTGREWPIFPLYDFAHPLSDAIENVTHSLCTLEFENNREVYDWLLDHLIDGPRPHQYEFARLNLDYTVMSKRRLRRLVEEGHVHGWDDPRMPTLAALRRKGVTPEAVRELANRVGVAKANSRTDPSLLNHSVRDDLNTRAPRVLAVLDPLDVELTNLPAGHVEWLDAPYWPHDIGKDGSRRVPLTRELVIEREDFELEPGAGFKRLTPGRAVRLRHGYVIRCDEVVTGTDGGVTKLLCSAYLDTVGEAPEGVKVWATLHWVSRPHGVPFEGRLYEQLFDVPNPDASDDFTAHLNPSSERIVMGLVEPSVSADDPGTRYQFERLGYFWRDPSDSSPDALVFNRIVALKDGFRKRGPTAAPVKRGQGVSAVKTPDADAPVVSAAAVAMAARHGIAESEAEVLLGNEELAGRFHDTVAAGAAAGPTATWVVNELAPLLRDRDDGGALLSAASFAELIGMVETGAITQRVAKDLLGEVIERGTAPGALVRERGLGRLDDRSVIDDAVGKALAAHPAELASYLGGKDGLRGFFIGQVMRLTQGRADAALVQAALDAALARAAAEDR